MLRIVGIALFVAISGCIMASAQPLITASDHPWNPGTDITVLQSDTAMAVDPGPSGPNQTWDFSNMSTPNPWVQYWVDPTTTPFFGEFPNSNRCMFVTGNQDGYVYYSLSQRELWNRGGAVDSAGNITILHLDGILPDETFPISYGSEWWSQWECDLGMGYHMVDNTHHRVDAWGTVITASGSYECLRIQTERVNETTLFGFPVFTATFWDYKWMTPELGGVANMVSQMNEPNPYFTVGSYNCMGSIQFPSPDVTVTMTPYGAPIVIPATGGSFNYNIALSNDEPDPVNLDVWVMMQRPTGSWSGPYLGPVNLTMQGSFSLNRDRTQNIAANAGPGLYRYEGRVGRYPDEIWNRDSFTFEKSATGAGELVGDWNCYGDDFAVTPSTQVTSSPVSEINVLAHPNPFNAATTFRFTLPEAAPVRLTIFNLQGERVLTLLSGWREAGEHEVTLDGADLTSGVYLSRLEIQESTVCTKIVLIK
ncbi:MAG: T9SS type A sorting domain-containing protein [bacterium]